MNVQLETGGKVILVIKNFSLLKLCPNVVLKGALVSNGLGHFAEKISKLSMGGTVWFLLAIYREKILEKNKHMIKFLNPKKEKNIAFENAHPIEIMCSEFHA